MLKTFFKFIKKNPSDQDILRGVEQTKLNEACKLFKEARKNLKLSIRYLSDDTHISIRVIEAIENQLVDQLPEEAYLSKILDTLEKRLYLEKGTLHHIKNSNRGTKVEMQKKVYISSGIRILSSYQGTILYIIAITFSIFAINIIQTRITIKNLETVFPINPLIEGKE